MKNDQSVNFTSNYVDDYFALLKNTTEIAHEKFVSLLKESIFEFIKLETVDRASIVYKTFLDTFRIKGVERNSPLADLADLMKMYEQGSMNLTDFQRDHYVHSINVFIIGICIYASNEQYRIFFRNTRSNTIFSNAHEEFLYVWGEAALFHDVGYPIEISYNMISRFLKLTCAGLDNIATAIEPIPKFRNIAELTMISNTYRDNRSDIANSSADNTIIDSINIFDLLASRISKVHRLKFEDVKKVLYESENRMADSGRVDHGFFSSLIVMKWLGELICKSDQPLERYHTHIVESACAILLHNFYGYIFTKEPFNLGAMSPARDPISYLLILCDELQEWNRTIYGAENIAVYPSRSRLVIQNKTLHMEYRTSSEMMSSVFPQEKTELLYRLLDIEILFPKGIEIVCTCDDMSNLFIRDVQYDRDIVLPSEFVDHILDIAADIHQEYIDKRRAENKIVEYGGWDTLSDSLKYSNLKQAYSYRDKLAILGYYMAHSNPYRTGITHLTEDEIDILAKIEHDRWVEERRSSGWIYGPEKDSLNRISPYIAPWNDISEEIKEYDREPMRNMLPILKKYGIDVCRLDSI